MTYVLYIGVFIYLFMSTTTAAALGIAQVGTFSSFVLFLAFIYHVINGKTKLIFNSQYKEEMTVLKVCCLVLIVRFVLSDYESIAQLIFFMVLPILFSILIAIQYDYIKMKVRTIVMIFYFAECALAIIERVLLINIFPYENEEVNPFLIVQNWEFRSSAFLGHPLMNALCVSTIMGFILTAKYTVPFKSFSLFVGFISLLCFNARGAVLVWCLIGFLFFILTVREAKKNKVLMSLIFLSVVGLLGYLVFFTELGGRLTNQDSVIDDSAQSRLLVYSTINYISTFDFLFGNPKNYAHIISILNLGGIENSYIVLLINYGVILCSLLIYSLFKLIRKQLVSYTMLQKLIIVLSFVCVGSLNNSLAGPTAWIVFLICSKVFSLQLFQSDSTYYNNRTVRFTNYFYTQ